MENTFRFSRRDMADLGTFINFLKHSTLNDQCQPVSVRSAKELSRKIIFLEESALRTKTPSLTAQKKRRQFDSQTFINSERTHTASR